VEVEVVAVELGAEVPVAEGPVRRRRRAVRRRASYDGDDDCADDSRGDSHAKPGQAVMGGCPSLNPLTSTIRYGAAAGTQPRFTCRAPNAASRPVRAVNIHVTRSA
jgi:hypothetical protein